MDPRYSFDKRLGGNQSWSGHCEGEKNLFPLLGIEPSPSIPYPVVIPINHDFMFIGSG
jgi:hypothetical protein